MSDQARASSVPGSLVGQWFAKAAPLASCLVVLAFWFLQFRPILVSHQNLLGYRLLDPRYTGMPEGEYRKSIFNKLPSQDCSMLQIHFPYQMFLAREFHRGTFPLWNPLAGCGEPVTSDPQYKPWNPFFWPFYASPSPWMFSLCIAAMALVGLAGFLVFFRGLGLGWTASAAGAVLAVFNPMTQQTVALSSPWVAWLVPWGLWGIQAWHRGRRWGLVVVAAEVGLTVYTGHPMIALLYGSVVAAYLAFMPSPWSRRERIGASLTVAAAALMLAAVHVLPLASSLGQYWSYKLEWDGGPYHQWLSLVNPRTEIFVPAPIWGFAFAGLALGRRAYRWFFFACAAYGAVLMFPWIGPGLLRWGMTFGGMLVARYGSEAFWFGLIGLSALGVHAFIAAGTLKEYLAPFRLFFYGLFWYLGLNYASEIRGSLYWPQVYKKLFLWQALACLPVVLLLMLPKRRWWTAPACATFLLILLVPWKLPQTMDRYFSSVDLVANPPALVKAMESASVQFPQERMTGAYYPGELLADLAPNQGLCWGLSDVRLTNPLILQRFEDFNQHWNVNRLFGTYCQFPRQRLDLLQFLGVRWAVADTRRPMKDLPERESAPPLDLQEVPDAQPWVRPVGRWSAAANDEDGWKRTFGAIRSGAWRDEVVLSRDPGLAPATAGIWQAPRLAWLESGPNRWRWRVEGRSPSLIVVLMNSHPGWRGEVDGRPVPVLRAYGTFMALPVGAGVHDVALSFHAPWFWAGAVVSLLGWMGLCAWAWAEWRRRGRRTGDVA